MEQSASSAVNAAAQTSPGISAATTQMVAKVASALASQTGLGDVAATIVTSLTDMGAKVAYVLLHDPALGKLTLAAQKGLPIEFVEQLSVVSLDAPLAAALAAKRRSLQVIADVSQLDPQMTLTRSLLRETGSKSLIAAPLIAFGSLVGVLAWTEQKAITLQEDEVATIKSIAEVFALGIVNAHNVAALRESNKRFEEIIDTTPIGMSLVSLDGRFIRPNRALCELVGYDLDELRRLRFQDITHPDDLDTDLELANKLLQGEIPRYTLPKRYIRKDGKLLHVVLHGSVIRDGGRPLYFIAQIQDVTEAKQREEALRQSEARFRLLAENARDLIYRLRLGDHPRFEFVSPSATRITGYTPEEHYADPQLGFKLVHPDDRGILEEVLRDPEQATKPLVIRFLRKNGEQIWVEQINTPVHDADGKLVAIEGFARDITDRKLAEEALVESEERLRFIVEHSPDAIFIQDRDLRYVWVANTFPGFTPEEFIGRTEFDMLPMSEAARIAFLKRIVMQTGEETQSVAEFTYKGRKMFLDVRYAPWRDRAGNIIGVAGFTRDITQSVLTERALRENEERLELAQGVARIGSWDWDLETDRISWSPEVYRIFGLPADYQPTYQDYLARLLDEDRKVVENRVREALSGGPRYAVDHRLVRPDGTELVVHEEADIIGGEGAPKRMLGTVQDITERYNLEKEREHLLEAVAAEKQWIETIVERSPIGILLFDQHGQVRSNKRADELFGRSIRAEHGREQYVEQLFGLDGRRLRLEDLPYSRVMRGESSEGAEFIIKRPDGSQINVLASAASITDNEGKAIGGVGVFEDITPIRRLEKMREEWVGIVAHDLRQPLTAMASQAELLKMRCSQVGDYAAAFDRFLEAIHRMNQMTKELLDASVIESRRVDLHAARRDLRTLTSDILQRASGLHAEFQFAMPREPIVAFVDPQRYEQILLNLLTNAVKYGRPDRPVEIRLSQSGPYARVSVTNEGEGIAENELPLVFDRYHRAGRGKAKAPGIGLGLYIVKGLVEAHGGAVGVESKPGDKTTFSFTLPVAAVH